MHAYARARAQGACPPRDKSAYRSVPRPSADEGSSKTGLSRGWEASFSKAAFSPTVAAKLPDRKVTSMRAVP